MVTYDLTRRGRAPLYDYLARQLKEDIGAGRLKPGEKLPSKRALAQHLSLSVITVQTAYEQLLAEGYLTSHEKSGYFVSASPPIPQSAPPLFSPEPAPPVWLADFRANSISADYFPFALWAKLIRGILSQEDSRLLRSAPTQGLWSLRQAIAEHLYRFRGLCVQPERVVIGAGTEYLYSLLIQLLGREAVYAIEDPGYLKVADICRLNGALCRHLPLDSQGLSLHALAAGDVQIVHLSPSHHFPTGRIMPMARRWELIAWAQAQPGRWLIEDDYDSEFRFDARPMPPLQSLDEERVIYVNTFSKTIAPSIRVSYLVLPPALALRYQALFAGHACTVPSLEQHTLAQFISQGHFEKHINRMKKRYRALRDEITHIIRQSPLSSRAEILEENAGLHFLLRLDTAQSDGELAARAAREGIRLSFLSDYAAQPARAPAHHLIVNYSGLTPAAMSQACRLLQDFALEPSPADTMR